MSQKIWKVVGVVLATPALLFGEDGIPRDLRERLGDDLYRNRMEAEEALAGWMGSDERRVGVVFEAMEEAKDPEVRIRMRGALKAAVLDRAERDGPGFLGVQMMETGVIEGGGDEAKEAKRSVLEVTMVVAGSPAEKGGLKVGDRILALDGKGFEMGRASQDFTERVARKRAGDEVELKVLKKGQEVEEKVVLVLMARPMSLPKVNGEGAVAWGMGPGMALQGNLLLGAQGRLVEDPEWRRQEEERAREAYFRDWLRERRQKER